MLALYLKMDLLEGWSGLDQKIIQELMEGRDALYFSEGNVMSEQAVATYTNLVVGKNRKTLGKQVRNAA